MRAKAAGVLRESKDTIVRNILIELDEYEKHASETEKGIIRFILKDPLLFTDLSIHEAAKQTFSSPSSVTRLCRHLGYEKYRDMKKALIEAVLTESRQKRLKTRNIQKEDDLETIVEQVTARNMLSLKNTISLIDAKSLEDCVSAIDETPCLFLFGVGSSLLVAQDAYLKFLRVDKLCVINADWDAQLVQARNIKPGYTALMISYSGRTKEMIRCAEKIIEAGAKLILVTKYDVSPLAKMADICLYVASSETPFRSGAMSSRIAQLNVIDIIYTAYLNRNYEKNIETIYKTHLPKE